MQSSSCVLSLKIVLGSVRGQPLFHASANGAGEALRAGLAKGTGLEHRALWPQDAAGHREGRALPEALGLGRWQMSTWAEGSLQAPLPSYPPGTQQATEGSTPNPSQGGLCPWPPFLPLTRHVPALGPRCPGQASGPAALPRAHFLPRGPVSTLGGGQSEGPQAGGVKDAPSPAVAPLVLGFLPPLPAAPGRGPGSRLCGCQGSGRQA